MQIYSFYCAYLCANCFSVNNLPLICHACGGIRNWWRFSDISGGGAGSILISISSQGFYRKRLHPRLQTLYLAVANVILGGCKRYTWRTQTLSLADACICLVGCKYVQERLQVRVGTVASTCVWIWTNRLGGCSALQDGMHCTAGRVALHCGEGCTALRGKPLIFSQPHGLCHEQWDEGFLARARIRIYIMYNSSSSNGKSFRKRP